MGKFSSTEWHYLQDWNRIEIHAGIWDTSTISVNFLPQASTPNFGTHVGCWQNWNICNCVSVALRYLWAVDTIYAWNAWNTCQWVFQQHWNTFGCTSEHLWAVDTPVTPPATLLCLYSLDFLITASIIYFKLVFKLDWKHWVIAWQPTNQPS